MFVNSAVSQYPSLAFQFAFDQAGENFHTAALMLSGRGFWSGYAVVVKKIRREYRENSDGKIGTNVSKPSREFNVCMGGDDGRYGWLG